jgi:hypothetical protein
MNRFKTSLLSLLAIFSFALVSCGGGSGGGDDTPQPTPEEQRILDLAGSSGSTWTATSITFEGSPAQGFENFSLTLRGTLEGSKTYSTVDGDPVFNASGSWELSSSNINQITIDGNANNVFTISNFNADASPATLTLTVDFTAAGGGSANGVDGIEGTDGRYVFNLQAQ